MKKILILFGKESIKNSKPFRGKKYQRCYETLYDLARKHELDLYRASYEWYDFKKNIFSHAWTYKKRKWHKVRNLRPHLIYDKAETTPETDYFRENIVRKYKILNNIEFTFLAGHKLFSSLLFPEYTKKCYLAINNKNLQKIGKKIRTRLIVLKPAIGSGGRNIKIMPKRNISRLDIKEEKLAQEFIDSAYGIEGIVSGLHDLRLVFVNNNLIYSYVRVPSKGSYLANLAQGGSMFIVKRKNLPNTVFPLIKRVQRTFEVFKRKIYTIDLMFDKSQKPWIVELNTMPGIYFSPDQKKWQSRFYLELIKIFKEEIEEMQD